MWTPEYGPTLHHYAWSLNYTKLWIHIKTFPILDKRNIRRYLFHTQYKHIHNGTRIREAYRIPHISSSWYWQLPQTEGYIYLHRKYLITGLVQQIMDGQVLKVIATCCRRRVVLVYDTYADNKARTQWQNSQWYPPLSNITIHHKRYIPWGIMKHPFMCYTRNTI